MKLRLISVLKQYAYIFGMLLVIFLLTQIGIGWPCPIYTVTGLYCPGCGTTRMALGILQLDFYSAFCANECLFILLPIAVILLITGSIKYIITGKKSNYTKITIILFILVFVIFGIVRNIPYFYFLRP